jgi:hypothetical protein
MRIWSLATKIRAPTTPTKRPFRPRRWPFFRKNAGFGLVTRTKAAVLPHRHCHHCYPDYRAAIGGGSSSFDLCILHLHSWDGDSSALPWLRLYSKTFPRNTASFLYFFWDYLILYHIVYAVAAVRIKEIDLLISHFIRTAIFVLFGYSKESVLFEDMTLYASVSLFLFSLLRQTLILTLPVTKNRAVLPLPWQDCFILSPGPSTRTRQGCTLLRLHIL